VGGRQGCGLATMAAVGIQLGSVDEGSPLGPGQGARRLHSGLAGWPAALATFAQVLNARCGRWLQKKSMG